VASVGCGNDGQRHHRYVRRGEQCGNCPPGARPAEPTEPNSTAADDAGRCAGLTALRVSPAVGSPLSDSQEQGRSPGITSRRGRAHGCPVPFARDCTVLDFATHSDLTGRLHGLVILLGWRLTLDQARSADSLIDASEFELALEMLANRLSEDATAIPDDVRRDFEKISQQMGNAERVMRPLDLCPADTSE
jgi:hypothetical protein